MITIETQHHITFSSHDELPVKYCTGVCKKAWWRFDFKEKGSKFCPQCGGKLKHTNGSKGYGILAQELGNLKKEHILAYLESDAEGIDSVDKALKMGGIFEHLSFVKPEYVAHAKANWS